MEHTSCFRYGFYCQHQLVFHWKELYHLSTLAAITLSEGQGTKKQKDSIKQLYAQYRVSVFFLMTIFR